MSTMSTALVFLIGTFYALVGVVFAWPTTHVGGWRLAAWLVSGVVFAGHIAYERLSRGRRPAAAAWRVAFGVAIGAFGLALAANVHAVSVHASDRQRRLLHVALLAWPAVTAVPAYVVAFVLSAVLRRFSSAARPVSPRGPLRRPE